MFKRLRFLAFICAIFALTTENSIAKSADTAEQCRKIEFLRTSVSVSIERFNLVKYFSLRDTDVRLLDEGAMKNIFLGNQEATRISGACAKYLDYFQITELLDEPNNIVAPKHSIEPDFDKANSNGLETLPYKEYPNIVGAKFIGALGVGLTLVNKATKTVYLGYWKRKKNSLVAIFIQSDFKENLHAQRILQFNGEIKFVGQVFYTHSDKNKLLLIVKGKTDLVVFPIYYNFGGYSY